jgi:hypothetical protein
MLDLCYLLCYLFIHIEVSAADKFNRGPRSHHSQVSKTVAMLRSHRDLRVAQQAADVVVAWRVNATAVLDRTQLVMSALPRASGPLKKRKSRVQEDS